MATKRNAGKAGVNPAKIQAEILKPIVEKETQPEVKKTKKRRKTSTQDNQLLGGN